MEKQDLITDEAKKEELETIKYVSLMQSDDANGDNVPNTSNSTNAGNEASQNYEDKAVYYEERYVPVGNEAYEQDEVIADKIVTAKIPVSSKRTRRSNRLSVNDKKENLKPTICGKVLKQKRTTKKSNKIAQSTISNEMLAMLYKKFESERQEKSMLPSFRYITPNNANNALQYIPCGIVKQEESYYNHSNNNRNMLQYLDNMRYESIKQPILMNSNPLSIVSKNSQNFILNNTQNQVGQTSFINDKQYYNAYIAADYNSKQSENPYFHSSIKSIDSHKLLSLENKVFRCSCNVCTSNMWNNMHPGVEAVPKMNNTLQQIANNNNTLSYNPLAATSNVWNTAVGPFNFPNYQPLQADYNFKRLFYNGFSTMNNTNNSGYNVMARKDIMSPLNNWNNHLTFPYNSNVNVLDTSIPSEPLSSSSLYTSNANTQFSNYYNKDLTKVDMSMDQYKERDNFNPSTISTFENSLPANNTHGLSSESTNTLSQNSTSTNESSIIYDIPNFVSDTNTANGSEESPSYIYAKEMDKTWLSNISNI